MEKTIEQLLPLLDVRQGIIISKQGDATLGFRVELPELFTLSDPEYEAFHQAWLKAFRVLPKHTVLCKQDRFIHSGHTPDFTKESFLDRSSERLFNERPFLDHSCYLYLTKKPAGRKNATSLFSSLTRPSLLPKETLGAQALQDFRDACGQFQRILQDSGFVRIYPLGDADIYSEARKVGLLEQYCSLSKSKVEYLYGDVAFDEGLLINGNMPNCTPWGRLPTCHHCVAPGSPMTAILPTVPRSVWGLPRRWGSCFRATTCTPNTCFLRMVPKRYSAWKAKGFACSPFRPIAVRT